ncbi:MAG TPA: Tn3 family transposase, partial [Herpetosiphonaceae bacterium]
MSQVYTGLDTKRLRLLDPADRAALYDRPIFTDEERGVYFALTPAEAVLLATWTDGAVQAFFILLLGYFKAKPRLFSVTTLDAVLPDLTWICQYHALAIDLAALRIPNDRTIQQQRQFILDLTGYRRCRPADRQAAFQLATQAARFSPNVSYLLRIVLHHFDAAKITLPGYTYLQEQIIGKAITTEEARLVNLLADHLTDDEQTALDALLEPHQGHYPITGLRRIPRNLRPRALGRERRRQTTMQPLAAAADRILPLLDLSPDAIRHYAGMVGFYSAARLAQLRTWMVDVYLLCFLHHRTQRLHDHLLSGFMQIVKTIRDDAKAWAKEQVTAYRLQRSADIKRAGRVLHLFTTDQLAPTLPLAQVQERAFAILPADRLDQVADYLASGADCDEGAFFWTFIDDHAQGAKAQLRPLLRAMVLTTPHGHTPLLEAVQFLQATITRRRTLADVAATAIPTRWIPVRLKRYLYGTAADGTPQVDRDRYEFGLYQQLRAALESGELVCPTSTRFRSLEDDLIPLAEWQANKETLIAATNLPILQQPITEHLAELEQEIEAQWARVNGRIARGENTAIQITQHGTSRKWTLKTPKSRERANHALYEHLPQTTLAQVLATVDAACGFMDAFDHVLGRYARQRPDDRVIHACLIAWGTNVGLHRMGEMSDIATGALIRASGNYVRLETLRAATTIIVNAIAAKPLFQAYTIDGVVHSSSDGQKFATIIDTPRSQHAARYFATGKGVVAHTVVTNHLPIITGMLSAHDHEGHALFDLLYNNETAVRSTIHSTDTHGTNLVNFAILSVFGHDFAPRYANLQDRMRTSLYGFQPPAAYGEDALFRPVRKLNTELIISEWDQLQRIFVSLARKTVSQHVLIQKLSSAKRRNRTLQALWEYDHIPETLHLLAFVDSPRRRQNVQRALNRGEQYHHLKKALTHGHAGKLRYISEDEQDIWNEASRLLTNAIIFYNMTILEQAIAAQEAAGNA